mgnify:FL=1
MWQSSYDDSPTLYLVPTPIGNLEDMTYRSINILSTVEVIFSEDTRVTLQLLNHFDIKKKLIALHDHNEDIEKEKVLEYLKNGKSVAIVTDRGTPIISDPGYKTVKYVTDNGYNVVGLPGANAFVPALITSGIEPSPFMFYGFLNSKDSKRKTELESLKFCKYTIIFYEAPHRIKKTMEEILEIFGDRQVSLSREISKKFESIYRGNISDLLPTLDNIKGEFVIVVSPYKEDNSNNNKLSVIDNVKLYIENGMEVMDAIKRVAMERNIPKNEIYREYHRR